MAQIQMADEENIHAAYLAKLRAEKLTLEHRLRALTNAIAAIESLNVSEQTEAFSAAVEHHVQSDEPEIVREVTSRGETSTGDQSVSEQLMTTDVLRAACYGKSIADAGMAVLGVVGHALPENELVSYLQRGGVTFVSPNAANSLRFAMRRKVRDHGGVKEVATKVWGLSTWPESSESYSPGFAAPRSKADHMAASLKGLQAAKDRGVRLGSVPLITAEHAPKIADLVANRTPMAQIADHFNFSVPGMIKAIKRLRDQGLVPPAPRGRPRRQETTETEPKPPNPSHPE
jgi:hypothetical protein